MNGAQALIRTLVACGVDVCFTNPGTSEMHFVAALDDVPEMRGVLALFEGVATGAADGYGRMAERPAATLLHLGPGLGNGLANLHNARRARTPIVNIVGDHALDHQRYDAQLQSDIETVARNVSTWIRSSRSSGEAGADAAEAVAAATGPPGQIATLVLPADVSWNEGAEPAPPRPPTGAAAPDPAAIDAVADGAALRRAGRAARGRPGASAAGPSSTRPASPRAPGPSSWARRSPPAWSAAPVVPRWNASPTWPSSPSCRWPVCATSCWSTPRHRCRSSPTPTRPATWCPTAAPCTPWLRADGDIAGALALLAEALGVARRGAGPGSRRAPRPRRAR